MRNRSREPEAGFQHGTIEVAPLLLIAALTLIAMSLWLWHSARAEVRAMAPPSLLMLHGIHPEQTSPTKRSDKQQRLTPPPNRKRAASARPQPLHVPQLPAGVIGQGWRKEGGRAALVRPDSSKLHLSVDAEVQSKIERFMKRKGVAYGGVVLMDPKTGAIRAFAEHHQTSDPAGAGHGLTLATAPAASVFKVVSGAALLEAGVHPEERTCFHGGLRGITKGLLKPSSRDNRCETLAMSMARSSNVAFARQTLSKLTPEVLTDAAERLGFGGALPFDVKIGGSAVNIPTDPLGLGRASAGFVGSRLSPLHAATLAATVANDGAMMRPWIVASDTLQPGRSRSPEVLSQAIAPEVAQALRGMMELTVSQGTARKQFRRWPARFADVTVGGKTGSLSETRDGVWRHYTWFVGFAPADKPEIAVAALAVNGKKWRTRGPTLARIALQAWLSRRRPTSASNQAAPKDHLPRDARTQTATKVLDTALERG